MRVARRARRRASSVGVLLLVVGGLLGCQAIPASGPVHEGLANLDQAEQPVQFDVGGPIEGASQEQIIRGFVSAGKSSLDDYAVAREFLTPDYADGWEPTDGVFVDEGTQSYHEVDEDIGELSLTGVATVDGDGTLVPSAGDGQTTMRFEFEQVGDEWRISSAPNGIILDSTTFAAVWTPRQLYFLSPDDRLVPETRWFLNRQTLATQIVGGLLGGPSDVDAQALRTAFPSGSTLASRAVPISGGNAQIELSSELLSAEPEVMELVKSQLATSLQSVPGVTGFELSINGAVVEEGPVVAPEGDPRSVEYLQPVVLEDGVLGQLSGGDFTQLPKIGKRIVDLHPSAVSLNADRTSAAVKHSSGGSQVVSWVSADDVVTLDVRSGVVAPSLDPFGYVWSYAKSQPGKVFVDLPGQSSEMLDLPGLNGRTAAAVRVSPGGNRIAMLVRDDEGSAVIVASIIRDEQQKPVGISEKSTRTMGAAGSPVDLDWVDELRLATLTKSGAGVKVTIGTLGQLPVDNGVVSDAVVVSGGGSRTLMRLLDSNGQLLAPQGSGWQRQDEGVELLARTG